MERDEFIKILQSLHVDESMRESLLTFFDSYLKMPVDPTTLGPLFTTFAKLVEQECISPTQFSHFHSKERSPFDFYLFALDMVRPLIDFSSSKILGKENLEKIDNALQQNENVILFVNHQTEIEPQIIDLLISKEYPRISSSLIFIAGHRVTTDPFAIPFARGANVLSIYSKKYIEAPPEQKAEKMQHNVKTLAALESILNDGGACVYVAPSGGRDRYDATGAVALAPFDPNSVEMFHLLSRKVEKKTHFHPLALSTIKLLPPPSTTQIEIGEERYASYGPAHLFFGDRFDFSKIPLSTDRKDIRKERCDALFAIIQKMYSQL
jgi:glycerol-3-phosphate O-acyltransferase